MATLPSLPTWIGNKGLNETPHSPEIVEDTTKASVTRIYEGPIALCQSSIPTIGQTFSDLPGSVVVVGSRCIKMPGAKGQLTINLETPYATTYETEWVEVDRALILNPRYWDGSTPDTSPPGAMPLSLTDKAMIDSWEQEPDAYYKLQFQFKVMQPAVATSTGIGSTGGSKVLPTLTNQTVAGYSGQFNIYTLSSQAQDYASKRLKGEESYRIYAPVVRQVSESLTAPEAYACGSLESPPGVANAPGGYVWQRSAARISRTGPYGKYRTQCEWQGADRIDVDLYGGSAGGSGTGLAGSGSTGDPGDFL